MYEFEQKEEYSLIPNGEYEVILERAERRTANSGKEYINLTFRIRNDVNQQCQGRTIFEAIFPDRERMGQFDHKKLGSIIRTQGASGKYSFADDDELIQYINGLAMRITIEIKEPDEYHTENYNQIKYRSYKPSNAGPKSLAAGVEEMKEKFGEVFDVSAEDLPF